MPRILKVDPWNPEEEFIEEGAALLRSGRLVAFPTETVYGLGANGLDGRAVARIFSAKGRPSDNPLILHFSAPREVEGTARLSPRARRLMELFWPGPLTLVLPAREGIPPEVTAGLSTVAVRMPSHPVALALLSRTGFPVAAPSANSSGRPSPTDAASVASDLGDRVDLILDGGSSSVGVESTVLDLTGPEMVLLRPGGCPVEEIEIQTGEKVLLAGGSANRSPGTRYRHYAPLVPLLLAGDEGVRERVIAQRGRAAWVGMSSPDSFFGRDIVPGKYTIRFSSPENYARGLFSALRTLEASGARIIVAEWPEEKGIGRALRDRLYRASREESPGQTARFP